MVAIRKTGGNPLWTQAQTCNSNFHTALGNFLGFGNRVVDATEFNIISPIIRNCVARRFTVNSTTGLNVNPITVTLRINKVNSVKVLTMPALGGVAFINDDSLLAIAGGVEISYILEGAGGAGTAFVNGWGQEFSKSV